MEMMTEYFSATGSMIVFVFLFVYLLIPGLIAFFAIRWSRCSRDHSKAKAEMQKEIKLLIEENVAVQWEANRRLQVWPSLRAPNSPPVVERG